MNYTFFGGNNVINDISRDAIKSIFEVAAWTHSKRVTTRYYRQDSRSVGQTENGEFNALSPLSKCYSARSNVSPDALCLIWID